MPSIKVVLLGEVWHAVFEGEHRQDIVDVFGTDTLPTPFRQPISVDEVIKDLKRKNPDCRVYF